jgi:hypothetical protein
MGVHNYFPSGQRGTLLKSPGARFCTESWIYNDISAVPEAGRPDDHPDLRRSDPERLIRGHMDRILIGYAEFRSDGLGDLQAKIGRAKGLRH